ncbi:geranylgeranylglycerol-phosphate geranylgeranyltransferase [Flavobacterium macrobrachii]|uniref:Geranylgeranylglycerol-phosphate geranylgeranyltransferase n=2 Tax=Flavobacterium macrobrachii TaxID=591204 RepID=A0ABS2CZG3_9FLAO|nr:geranylgeranylglycerol-phosphate geranylgeranyltransferase [Flavobacterium macrobrachii]MBM6499587.1 geranylgeranylglycerol-phosphate geranylgeranyltransferase [Flavobacterium macrobrachii]
MKYLKLIRFQNLLMIALMQCIIRYGFLKLQKVELALADWQFALLVLSTVFIAAGGYIINDIMDQETDSINRPNQVIVGRSISESMAYNLYFGFTIAGALIGFYLSNLIYRDNFFGIFIITSLLLYIYATSFKQIAVIGNILVSLALALSVIIVGLFDIIPATDQVNRFQMMLWLELLFDYAVFAFLLNFIREIIKDLEDINGDYNQGMRTLPIVLGVSRTAKVVALITVIATVILLWYINNHLMNSGLYIATIYALVFLVSPLIFAVVKVWTAATQKEFHLLSNVIKAVIFFGILFILIVNLNIKFNA